MVKFEHFAYGWFLITHSDNNQRFHLINCPYSLLDKILDNLKKVSSDNERGIFEEQQRST